MREQRPLILALILLWAMTFAVVAFFLNANETDQVVYSLDDPYIHMAMARNLVEHGVWGVTRYEFSSSSSSPLWVLLLASGYLVIGVRDFLPLLLVLAATSLALIVADRICRAQGIYCVSVGSQAIKKTMCDKKNASKAEVIEAVKAKFPTFSGWPKTKKVEHVADACGAALTSMSDPLVITMLRKLRNSA